MTEKTIPSAPQPSKAASRSPLMPAEHVLALTQMALARMAMRAGYKVLAYKLRPGERVGGLEGTAVVVTVNVPRVGQLAFGFSDAQAGLLAGVPNSSVYPVERKDVINEDFERMVRAMLTLCPEALRTAEESPWNGEDGQGRSHERLLESL